MRPNFIGEHIFFEEYYDDIVYVGYTHGLEMRKPRNRPAKYRGIISICRHDTKIFQDYQKVYSIQQMIDFLNSNDPENPKYNWHGREWIEFNTASAKLERSPISYWVWSFQRGVQNSFEHLGGLKLDGIDDYHDAKCILDEKIQNAKAATRPCNLRPISAAESRDIAAKHFPTKKVLKKIMLLRLSDQHH